MIKINRLIIKAYNKLYLINFINCFSYVLILVHETGFIAAQSYLVHDGGCCCAKTSQHPAFRRQKRDSEKRSSAIVFLLLFSQTHQTPCCHCTLFSRRETRESIRQPAREKMHSTTMLDDDIDDTDVDVSCRVAVSHHRQLLGTPENLSKWENSIEDRRRHSVDFVGLSAIRCAF